MALCILVFYRHAKGIEWRAVMSDITLNILKRNKTIALALLLLTALHIIILSSFLSFEQPIFLALVDK